MQAQIYSYETLQGMVHAYTNQLLQMLARPIRNSTTVQRLVNRVQLLMNQLTPADYKTFYNNLPDGIKPSFQMPRNNRNNRPGRNYSQENLNLLRRASPETYNWLTKRNNY